jgi:hypothetical protein
VYQSTEFDRIHRIQSRCYETTYGECFFTIFKEKALPKRKKPSAPFSILDSRSWGDYLRERMGSGQWWTFISVNGVGTLLLAAIEEEHYAGRANKFFELTMSCVPGIGFLAVSFAKKDRLSRKQLCGFYDRFGMPHEAETLSRNTGIDILALASGPELAYRAGQLLRELAGESVSRSTTRK